MDNIQKIVLIAHTLIAVLIIALVLLQRGKGADAGAAFGAGASGTVFGARGSASFFSRATAVLATLFFVSSLGLAYLSSQATGGPKSLLDDAPALEDSAADAADDAADIVAPAIDAADDATALPTFDAGEALPETDSGVSDLPELADDAAALPSLDDAEPPAEDPQQ